MTFHQQESPEPPEGHTALYRLDTHTGVAHYCQEPTPEQYHQIMKDVSAGLMNLTEDNRNLQGMIALALMAIFETYDALAAFPEAQAIFVEKLIPGNRITLQRYIDRDPEIMAGVANWKSILHDHRMN